MKNDNILDIVMNLILSPDSGSSPRFVRECDREIINELKKYTAKVWTEKMEREEAAVEFIEENAGELLDAVCDSKRIYMKKGMKIGIKMVFQLLGL